MTPEQNRNIPKAAEAVAAKAIAHVFADILRSHIATLEASQRGQSLMVLRQLLMRTRTEFARMTFPEMTAAESDLWAGEALDAFDDLSRQILEKIDSAR